MGSSEDREYSRQPRAASPRVDIRSHGKRQALSQPGNLSSIGPLPGRSGLDQACTVQSRTLLRPTSVCSRRPRALMLRSAAPGRPISLCLPGTAQVVGFRFLLYVWHFDVLVRGQDRRTRGFPVWPCSASGWAGSTLTSDPLRAAQRVQSRHRPVRCRRSATILPWHER